MTSLAYILQCAACGRDDDAARGWRTYLLVQDPPLTATFCPECAERMIGEDER